MKIGIIFCGFNTAATVEKSLAAWKEVRVNPPGGHEFVFSCVSVPFLEYKDSEIPADDTIEKVCAQNIMDFHVTEPKFIKETEARGICLEFLKKENVEIVWMVDLDEIYTVGNIEKIISYVESHSEISWFSLCLKNFVFSESEYLAAPFCPPRIYRTSFPPFQLGNFFEDNGISWIYNEKEISHQILPNKQIPKSCAWVKHLSWSDPIISRQKIDYQRSRGWNCDFTYDETGKISFNPFVFKDGRFPEILTEEAKINESAKK